MILRAVAVTERFVAAIAAAAGAATVAEALGIALVDDGFWWPVIFRQAPALIAWCNRTLSIRIRSPVANLERQRLEGDARSEEECDKRTTPCNPTVMPAENFGII